MTKKLRVRAYNVRFGDALLVRVPDRHGSKTTIRHILIDVGNVLMNEGGNDTVFKPVVANILKELNGKALDLYVTTHEHLDHVQGLFYAAKKFYAEGELKQKLNVQYTWMTGSAHPQYYKTHPDAKKHKIASVYKEFDRLLSYLDSLGASGMRFKAILNNNNPRSTKDCVDYLRGLAPNDRTFYVDRETPLAGKHPFKEAQFDIWAPEEDTSDYYKNILPMGLTNAIVTMGGPSPEALPEPPAGVDAGAFRDLLRFRELGVWDNLLAIDKAENNTSIVVALTWRGRRLLFSGDAEIGSWKKMDSKGVFKPVDLLKVSHHGSHNGTPAPELLDKFFPKQSHGKKRTAVISTWTDTYPGIPHDPTNKKLSSRGKLSSTLDKKSKLYRDFYLSGA